MAKCSIKKVIKIVFYSILLFLSVKLMLEQQVPNFLLTLGGMTLYIWSSSKFLDEYMEFRNFISRKDGK